MTTTQRALLQLAAVLVVLAAAGVLATVTTTLSGSEVYGIITVIAGGTAVAGGLALSATPANYLPHLLLIAAVLGLTVALAVEKVFGSTEVVGVFGFILGWWSPWGWFQHRGHQGRRHAARSAVRSAASS